MFNITLQFFLLPTTLKTNSVFFFNHRQLILVHNFVQNKTPNENAFCGKIIITGKKEHFMKLKFIFLLFFKYFFLNEIFFFSLMSL